MDQDRATVTEITLRSVTIWSSHPPQTRGQDPKLHWKFCLSLFLQEILETSIADLHRPAIRY